MCFFDLPAIRFKNLALNRVANKMNSQLEWDWDALGQLKKRQIRTALIISVEPALIIHYPIFRIPVGDRRKGAIAGDWKRRPILEADAGWQVNPIDAERWDARTGLAHGFANREVNIVPGRAKSFRFIAN